MKHILTLLRLANVGGRSLALYRTALTVSTVTPGITALEYHHRRANLAKELPKNSIAVLASSDIKYRSGAVFYEFHQEPNFYYLTGTMLRSSEHEKHM